MLARSSAAISAPSAIGKVGAQRTGRGIGFTDLFPAQTMLPSSREKAMEWRIERKGRAWERDEVWPRYEMAPEKLELIEGKLLWDDESRQTLLGLLLENLGADAAVRLGDPRVWIEAVDDMRRAMTP